MTKPSASSVPRIVVWDRSATGSTFTGSGRRDHRSRRSTKARIPMALRLSLKPHERVIIGGAALRNGGTRTELLIENEVPVLRESDILSPSMVRTPCERIYLVLQLMYVDPERSEQHIDRYRSLVADVAATAPSCRPLLAP